MATGVKAVDVFAELDRLKVRWQAAGDDEIRFCCPVHEDSTPSASLNVKEHLWKCHVPSCNASGDFVSLLAYFLKVERRLVLVDLQTRYPNLLAGIAEIPSQTVEQYHARIKDAGPLLQKLYDRGVTDEMIRTARLGFHDGKITIPIYDLQHRCINVRRYLPGAPGPQKMRNTTGHGAPALYRAETIGALMSVLICGGEMKALVAGTLLAEHKVAAVCSTGGEGHWNDEWHTMLTGKDVFVCMDVDPAGEAGARRIAQKLHGKVRTVSIVRLPLDKEKFPKGDINDYVGQLKRTGKDLYSLIESSQPWAPVAKGPPAPVGPLTLVDLDVAITQGKVGERIEVHAVIAAADQTPYLTPKDVDILCDREQPACVNCPIFSLAPDENGFSRQSIDSSSSAVLGMVNAPEREMSLRLSDALGIPLCKSVKFYPRSHHVVHDVRLSPPLDMGGNRVGDTWYPATIVSSTQTELNIPCRMRGALYPHPKTQQAVALINELEELEDSLANFTPSAEDYEALRECFQPTENRPLEATLDIVYADLEANVTWIFERRDMHIAYDLTWHSVLGFSFAGRAINGWMNLLVIGDSSQGKSECAARLLAHYGCGDRVDCKNATVAGLLGGLEQLGNRWFVRWGAIPARDRTLLLMEELKGVSTEVIAKLTDMRSSGVAEIPKIERRRAMARTRLAMISNPRSPRPMSSFHFGVEAIHELIGSLEDVRRFDLAIAVGKGEVSNEVINMLPSQREEVPHKITKDLSRKLVLWAWTRTPGQVLITPEATDAIVTHASQLLYKYNEAVPLVDQGTMRLKLARMAVALAARTFSTPDGHMLVVQSRHVEFAFKFVDRCYSSPVMGYDEFSRGQEMMAKVQDPKGIMKVLRNTKHPRDLASVLLRRDTVSLEDVCSASASDLDTSRALLSLLVRKGALIRMSKTEYAKNAQFIGLLKEVLALEGEEHDVVGEEF